MGGCVFSQASLLQAATSGSSDGGGGDERGFSTSLTRTSLLQTNNRIFIKITRKHLQGKYFVLINILTVKIRNSVSVLLFIYKQ